MFELDDFLRYPDDYRLEKIGIHRSYSCTYRDYYLILNILKLYKHVDEKIIGKIIDTMEFDEIPKLPEEQKNFFDPKIAEYLSNNPSNIELVVDSKSYDSKPDESKHMINNELSFDDDYDRLRLYEICSMQGWKNHELLTIQELYELVRLLKDYFDLVKIIGEDYGFIGFTIPTLKSFDMSELKSIIDEISKQIIQVQNKNSHKNFRRKKKELGEFFESDKHKLLKRHIKAYHYRNKYKNQFSEDNTIIDSDLEQLNLIIPKIRNYKNFEKIKSLEHAKLILANCEIISFGCSPKNDLNEANQYIRCLRGRESLKRKFPTQNFDDKNCSEIIKLFYEKVVPSFPEMDSKIGLGKMWLDEVQSRLERMQINLEISGKI